MSTLLTPFFIQLPKPTTDDTIALLIDEAAGIYIPRNFYKDFDFSSWGLDIGNLSEAEALAIDYAARRFAYPDA